MACNSLYEREGKMLVSSTGMISNNVTKPQPTKSVNPSFPSLEEVPIGSTGFTVGPLVQEVRQHGQNSKGSKPSKIFREFRYILNYMYKNQRKLF